MRWRARTGAHSEWSRTSVATGVLGSIMAAGGCIGHAAGARRATLGAMLLQLGRRVASEDVVDLLDECHGRIRRFLAMARALANAPRDAALSEIVATASQVRRYFAEGFALHVEDEEIDI